MNEIKYWLSIVLLAAAVIALVTFSTGTMAETQDKMCGADTSKVLDRKRFFDDHEKFLIETITFGSPGNVKHMLMMVKHDDGTIAAIVKFASKSGLVFHLGTCRQQAEEEFINENIQYVERIRHSTVLPYEPGE